MTTVISVTATVEDLIGQAIQQQLFMLELDQGLTRQLCRLWFWHK
jgi:hypothetical protein